MVKDSLGSLITAVIISDGIEDDCKGSAVIYSHIKFNMLWCSQRLVGKWAGAKGERGQPEDSKQTESCCRNTGEI